MSDLPSISRSAYTTQIILILIHIFTFSIRFPHSPDLANNKIKYSKIFIIFTTDTLKKEQRLLLFQDSLNDFYSKLKAHVYV